MDSPTIRTNYWEMFKESCLLLASDFEKSDSTTNTERLSKIVTSPCSITQSIYYQGKFNTQSHMMYWLQDYENQKNSQSKLSIGEFYWGAVLKFEEEKRSAWSNLNHQEEDNKKKSEWNVWWTNNKDKYIEWK